MEAIAARIEKNKTMLTSLVGGLITVVTLFSFASPDGGLLPTLLTDSSGSPEEIGKTISVDGFWESVLTATEEVFSITLPGSPADIAALTLGEGFSGFFSSSLVFG